MATKIDIHTVTLAVATANNAALEAALNFKEKYPEDCGDCGYATPMATNLSRKRKLRGLLEEAGVDLSQWSNGKWGVRVDMPKIGYNQQWRTYHETVRRAWMDSLFPALGIEGYLHSWAD